MARLSDLRGFVQKDSVQYSDLVSSITQLQGLVNEFYVAHGAMFEPVAVNDLTTPATVANQFTINAGQYRVNGTMVDLPATLVTLSAAPATSGLLSRKDLVYLQEDGTVVSFAGTDDSPTMVDAGFSAVAGEVGLWVNGGVYAIPLFTVQRRNQGAYHPYFNEWGTSLFQDGSGGFDYWYEPGALGLPVLDTQDCFDLLVGGSGGISQLGGRPDSKAYNAIYLSDITDLRLQAKAPSPTQLEPNYWQNKAVAGTLKHFVTEGIPKLVRLGDSASEPASTTTAARITLSNGIVGVVLFAGDFVVIHDSVNGWTRSGYVSAASTGSSIGLCTTYTAAIKNDTGGEFTAPRTNGAVYTLFKVEYTPATFADNTWTDIIGDPANYPRQATGVIDWDSDQGAQTVTTGMTVEMISGFGQSGTPGNVYLRIGADTSSALDGHFYAGSNWLDLGPKATFLANATGLEGFPLLYGENGEDLIPDGTSKSFKLNRKCVGWLQREYTLDKGVSWTADSNATVKAAYESATNAYSNAWTAASVVLQRYKTPAHIFSDATNSSVLGGKLSTCYASNYATATVGGAYISELISKVLTAVIDPIGLNKTVEDYAFLVAGDIYPNAFNKPTHAVLGLNDHNSSPAGKAVNYLHDTGSNIELFSVFKEMIYAGVNGWGDDNTFLFADNTTTDTDDNGNTILVGTKSTKLPIVGS